MKIRLSVAASDQLESIYEYILRDGVEAAAVAISRILDAIERLEQFPRMGREGRRSGTRELVLPPFVVVYRIREDVVAIDAILHSSRCL